MGSRDPRIDAYIDKAAPFARPILRRLRTAVHAACPEAVETLKWSMPHFLYKGSLLCGMAAFKKHAVFGFWRGSLVVDDAKAQESMGQYGCLTKVSDLPARPVLAGHVKKAMALTDAGVKAPRNKTTRRRVPLVVPADLKAALAKNGKARATYDELRPSHKREYLEWIIEAKQDATRRRRVAQAVARMSEGKPRHWKYA
jgi:uncharacterized protein YdeI (YjbR/CyaY-like superfamily)